MSVGQGCISFLLFFSSSVSGLVFVDEVFVISDFFVSVYDAARRFLWSELTLCLYD